MGHVVTAAAVQVAVGRRVHMLGKGTLLPEGVDPATVERLVKRGFIEAFEDAATESVETPVVELPSKSWNHDRIDAWAGELDPPVTFDPAEKVTKEQKLEVLAPAIEAARAAAEQPNQQ
jgi:hypothetical protein